MQRVHRHGFHGVQGHDVIEGHIGAFGNAAHLVNVLRIPFLDERPILTRLNLRAFPGQFQLIV
jgi:hypothetical protein